MEEAFDFLCREYKYDYKVISYSMIPKKLIFFYYIFLIIEMSPTVSTFFSNQGSQFSHLHKFHQVHQPFFYCELC